MLFHDILTESVTLPPLSACYGQKKSHPDCSGWLCNRSIEMPVTALVIYSMCHCQFVGFLKSGAFYYDEVHSRAKAMSRHLEQFLRMGAQVVLT